MNEADIDRIHYKCEHITTPSIGAIEAYVNLVLGEIELCDAPRTFLYVAHTAGSWHTFRRRVSQEFIQRYELSSNDEISRAIAISRRQGVDIITFLVDYPITIYLATAREATMSPLRLKRFDRIFFNRYKVSLDAYNGVLALCQPPHGDVI